MLEYCLPETESIWLLHSVHRLTFSQSSPCSILSKRYQNEPSFGDSQKAQQPLNGTNIISRALLNKAKNIYLLSY